MAIQFSKAPVEYFGEGMLDSYNMMHNFREMQRQRAQQQQTLNQQQNIAQQLQYAQSQDAANLLKAQQQGQTSQQSKIPPSVYQALLNNPQFRLFAEQNGLGQFVQDQEMRNLAQQQGPSFQGQPLENNSSNVGGSGPGKGSPSQNNITEMAKNPIWRAWYKKTYGMDPLDLPEIKQQREIESKRQEEFNKTDAAAAARYNEARGGSAAKLRTAHLLNTALNSSELENINAPWYAQLGQGSREKTLEFIRNYGSDEQKKLVGDLEQYSNELITEGASLFKGAFRVGEQELLMKMKVNPSDPLAVSIAKGRDLEKTAKFIDDINRITPKLIRQGYSEDEALEKALQQSGFDDFLVGIGDKDYGGGKEQLPQEKSAGFDPRDLKDTDMVIVDVPEGK